jgi:hypothetical protein
LATCTLDWDTNPKADPFTNGFNMRSTMTKPISFPNFSSPDLQRALEAARPALEGAEENRNRVSKDILALEAYLESLDLKVPFRFMLGSGMECPDDMDESTFNYNFAEMGASRAIIVEEALIWGPDGKGRNRLIFESAKYEGYFDVDVPGTYFPDRESIFEKDSRPLIECKFEVRKSRYEDLPRFIERLGEAMAIRPLQVPATKTAPEFSGANDEPTFKSRMI